MFIVVAIVTGIAIGLLRGGRFENLGAATFRLWPLLVLGVVVQGAAAFMANGAVALVLASYAILVLFAAVNIHHAGMGVVLVGVALNFVVIAANSGMPVRADAIVAAGIEKPSAIQNLDFGSKRHLERPDDRLTVLGDIIPVPAAGEVLSFGDLAMAVGVSTVLVGLLRRRSTRAVGADQVSRLRRRGSASPENG